MPEAQIKQCPLRPPSTKAVFIHVLWIAFSTSPLRQFGIDLDPPPHPPAHTTLDGPYTLFSSVHLNSWFIPWYEINLVWNPLLNCCPGPGRSWWTHYSTTLTNWCYYGTVITIDITSLVTESTLVRAPNPIEIRAPIFKCVKIFVFLCSMNWTPHQNSIKGGKLNWQYSFFPHNIIVWRQYCFKNQYLLQYCTLN